MKKFISILFLLFPMLFFSQDVERKSIDKTTGFIESNFNKKTINAYENRAKDKLNEFYDYLILLQSSNSLELQNQLKQNIKQLMINDDLTFQNIIENLNDKLSIDDFLNQLILKKVKINLPNNIQNTTINHNDFEFSYILEIIINEETKILNLTQKVYLFPVEKYFGSSKKTVWELKLGSF
jgi:hypothetical protein